MASAPSYDEAMKHSKVPPELHQTSAMNAPVVMQQPTMMSPKAGMQQQYMMSPSQTMSPSQMMYSLAAPAPTMYSQAPAMPFILNNMMAPAPAPAPAAAPSIHSEIILLFSKKSEKCFRNINLVEYLDIVVNTGGGGGSPTCSRCRQPLHTRVGHVSTFTTHLCFLVCCMIG